MNSRGGPPPSPPISIGRSSNGAGLYPMNQGPPPQGGPPPPGPGRKYSATMLEEQLSQHHTVLRDFIAQSQREDLSYQPHNRARDKLLRLSPIQFQELSTDVYDELLRRQDEQRMQDANGNIPPSVPRALPPKQNFHPKRNQARQKLATLASKKFRELATDVLFELERRFPHFVDGGGIGSPPGSSYGGRSRSRTNRMPPPIHAPGHGMNIRGGPTPSPGPYSPAVFDGRSIPSSSSSNDYGRPLPGQKTMIPNKSTMVEDDEDDEIASFDGRSSRRMTGGSRAFSMRDQQMASEQQAKITQLEQQVADMETQMHQKDEALESERSRSSNLSSDLEQKLKSAESLNSSLHGEIEKLRQSLSTTSTDGGEWKGRYEALEQDFHEQQQTTNEVRQEAMESLQEMRSLSQRAAEADANEERLTRQIDDLQRAADSWKTRYTKTKTQLRTMKATSMALYIQQPTATQYAGDGNFLDNHGLIKDISVTRFQTCIDELLQISREQEASAVIKHMRDVIESVRRVTEGIDSAPASGGEAEKAKRTKAKAKVSAATNNLITTAKTFSGSHGLAPVSLVDAAASHLTAAVVDLIKVVKIRPTPEHELDDGDDFA
ncbi:hypothetical protein FH972_022689 [Carpinus fangiana]|uniref:GIT Spa2 homology (SHD) domain-containing protein n=1 Tax=Carpinus fangiana TaxID=176857 RepID=A0A5N6KTG9_9ROSI|nr:hypothetical protein FH972_022689 [Carpinus fangiana]